MEPDQSSQVRPSTLEQQRQLIARACDVCRKKKIRCEPTAQGCARCIKYGTSCRFTPTPRRNKPRRPAGFRHIAYLEERLSKMEELLGDKASMKQAVSDDGSSEEQTIFRPSPPYAEAMNAHNNESSSRISTHTTPELGHFSLSIHQQLPTKEEALELVKEAFRSYNKFLPIFNEEDFLQEFQLKYTTSNPGDPGWWACINVVLSLGLRLRALRSSDPTQANLQADNHLQNALAVVSALNVSSHSLSAVQALVGMASILQGTPNPEPSSVLTAAALRLAQNMNMHRECSKPGLTASQVEQRRRVFWIAYILDKDISLRMERPFSQDDDDMDVQLPSKAQSELPEHDNETCAINILHYRIGLAVIQGQVYKQLYSIQAKRRTESQKTTAAQELNSALSYWKSIAEPEFPEESTIFSAHQLSDEMVHKVVLRLTYIHCFAMIDRHLPPMPRSSSDQDTSLSELLSSSGSACLAESRKAIRLLGVIPSGDCACVWMLLPAFFAAASTILRYLTWDPTSPEAHSDLRLVRPFLRLLETLARDQTSCSPSEEFWRMNNICNSLNNEAREAVQLFGVSTTGVVF